MTPKTATCLLALILAGSMLIRFPLLSVPFERDEGEYAYIAWRLDHGEIPYRDIFDQKPPGIFLLYYLTFLIDDSVEAIHGMMHVYTLFTILLVFLLSRRLSGSPGAGLLSAAAFSVASAQPEITGQAANTEIFMLLPLVASLYVYVRKWGRCRGVDLFWVGVLIGAAALFKQVALTTVLPVVVLQAFFYRGQGIRRQAGKTVAAMALVGLGVVAGWLPVLLFFGIHGAIGDVIQAVFLHNFRYLGTSRNEFSLQVLWGNYSPVLAGEWPLWGAACLGLFALFRLSREKAVFVLLWLASAAIGISASAYFFPHYFLQATPVQAVLAGIGAHFLVRWGFRSRRTVRRVSVALIAAWILVNPLLGDLKMFFLATPEEISYRIYPGNIFPDTVQVAHYIRDNSTPSDSMFVLGSEPQIPFHARRRHVGRFHFLFPLFGNYPDAVKNQYEVYHRVQDEKPRFVVVILNALFFTEGSSRMFLDMMQDLLNEQYRLEGVLYREGGQIRHVYGEPGLRELDREDQSRIILRLFRLED